MAPAPPTKAKTEPSAEAQAPAAKASPIAFIAVMLILTALGVGLGGLLGLQLLSKMEGAGTGKPEVRPGQGGAAAGGQAAKGRMPAGASVRALQPIVTNLGGPGHTWIRLEASLVESEPTGDAMSAQISEDIVAYLRTISLVHIQGASGFQHLREDLNDRVRVRSGGKVRDLVIQSMIVE